MDARRFNSDFRSTDGLVGAVISDERYIMTSPNSEAVPEPSLGNRTVILDLHLRFGQDDPLQWPQIFHPDFPHLACITLPPERSNDRLTIMWDNPSWLDFALEADIFVGISRMKHSKFCALVPLMLQVISRCRGYTMPVVPRLISVLENFLYKVKFDQNKPLELCLCIREAQRAFLELRACYDYCRLCKGVIDRKRAPLPWGYWGVDGPPNRLQGAFTFDQTVWEQLYHAEIPVWLIRPISEAGNIRVKIGKTPKYYSENAPLLAPYPAIYTGLACSVEKYKALQSHVYGLQGPDQWGTILVCTWNFSRRCN